jgi:hypothetical protein
MIRTLLFSALMAGFFVSTGFGCCDGRNSRNRDKQDPQPRVSGHCGHDGAQTAPGTGESGNN